MKQFFFLPKKCNQQNEMNTQDSTIFHILQIQDNIGKFENVIIQFSIIIVSVQEII